jgi:hypothetical protein
MATTSNAPIGASRVNNLMDATTKGFLKNCRFLVIIGTPRSMFNTKLQPFGVQTFLRELPFMCEAAEEAGRALQTVDIRHYGPSYKLPYQSVYNDMNLTFLCRGENKEKRFFDYWMNKINPNNTFNFEYHDDYVSSINIFTYDEAGKACYQQTLEAAYPIMVNPTQKTWADDQISRLTVTFTYKYYSTKEDPAAVMPLDTLVKGGEMQFGTAPFLGDPLNNDS